MTAEHAAAQIDVAVGAAPQAVEVEGRTQVVYELHIANGGNEALALESVAVRGADGAVIAEYAGKTLRERLALTSAGAAPGEAAQIAPAENGVVYVELEFPNGHVPRKVGHSVTFRTAAQRAARSVSIPPVPVDRSPPIAFGPPLAGGTWVAVHHPGWPRGHRRVFFDIGGRQRLPGRFAIDFVKVDDTGAFAAGDPDVVGNAHGYGADVLAVADAVVVAARDDMGEAVSVAANARHRAEDATGNYVALEVAAGRFVHYEHLKPGSVRVRTGDRVTAGEVIGKLGFSGDSTLPHLHFHVADANAPLDAEGAPFAFRSFSLIGHYADIEALGRARWRERDASINARRKAERPASNAVIKFER